MIDGARQGPRSTSGSRSTPTTPPGRATTPSSSARDRISSRSRSCPTTSSRWRRSTPRAGRAALPPPVPPLQRRAEQATAARLLHGRERRRRLEHAPQARARTAGSSIRACRPTSRRMRASTRTTRSTAATSSAGSIRPGEASREEAKHVQRRHVPLHELLTAARGLQPEPDDLGGARGLHPRERRQPQLPRQRLHRPGVRGRRRAVRGRPAPARVLEGRRHGQGVRRPVRDGVPPEPGGADRRSRGRARGVLVRRVQDVPGARAADRGADAHLVRHARRTRTRSPGSRRTTADEIGDFDEIML